MMDELLTIKNDALSLLLESSDEDVERIEKDFLGKKGRLITAMKEIPNLPLEQRIEIGTLANEIKKTIEELIKDKKTKKSQKKPQKSIDVTLPGIKPPLGSLHLVTQAIEEITSIFERIGFSRVRYPEVEYDWYAFEALNFPENHPARDDWETFFVDLSPSQQKGPILLTPHTSSGQIREMERVVSELKKKNLDTKTDKLFSTDGINIKMLNIAKCYRRQSDVSHTQMFHQFEGLVVGKNINISHLKGVLDYFVKSFFGVERTFRIRPYHFQFTEPSFEIDISCGVCKGKGCRLCKGGWLELGGAGMVHPNVLISGGIDPKSYTGFAFGWGVERVLMMKEGLQIDDLRVLYSNDLDFLSQF
jgi:phenylalanyl-tRNA synthetase alpha chain